MFRGLSGGLWGLGGSPPASPCSSEIRGPAGLRAGAAQGQAAPGAAFRRSSSSGSSSSSSSSSSSTVVVVVVEVGVEVEVILVLVLGRRHPSSPNNLSSQQKVVGC